jgi:enoyl-CoA hydratase/carnithine racemase
MKSLLYVVVHLLGYPYYGLRVGVIVAQDPTQTEIDDWFPAGVAVFFFCSPLGVMATPFTRLRLEPLADCAEVLEIVMSRPEKLNVMDAAFFEEIGRAAKVLEDGDYRCGILYAEQRPGGKKPIFTAGLDLESLSSLADDDSGTDASEETPFSERIGISTRTWKLVREWQGHFAALRKCSKPVIACVDGLCVGGGVDLTSFCDIRLCSSNSAFTIKETQIGITADVGTLQRIVKISHNGFARQVRSSSLFTCPCVSLARSLSEFFALTPGTQGRTYR